MLSPAEKHFLDSLEKTRKKLLESQGKKTAKKVQKKK
jgi:hypothetical protein